MRNFIIASPGRGEYYPGQRALCKPAPREGLFGPARSIGAHEWRAAKGRALN